ncbi:MAG TPA: CheR family methyltransferase, partial [Kofleriaceae bacterium]
MSLTPDIVAGVSRRLAEHAGLELPAWVVEARAAARIDAIGVAPSAYVDLIATSRGAGELATLIEAVRVGESSLFRHRPQVAALVEVIAPALRSKKAIKIWSAGCASGEEPFTLAVVMSRALPSAEVSVIATDVSAGALALAQAAHYPLEALDDIPEEWRGAFAVDDERVHVQPDVASLVTFERANLLDSVPPKQCDLVWCRNVLIY